MASGTNVANALSSRPFGNFQLFADQFLNINSNWSSASSTPAALAADTNDASVLVRLFDDTTDEGVGLDLYVPSGATDIRMTFIHREETSQTGAQTVGIDIFTIGDTGAWSATPEFNETLNVPNADESWQYEAIEISIASSNLTAGEVGQMQINCDASAGTITGDWTLRAILFEFF